MEATWKIEERRAPRQRVQLRHGGKCALSESNGVWSRWDIAGCEKKGLESYLGAMECMNVPRALALKYICVFMVYL